MSGRPRVLVVSTTFPCQLGDRQPRFVLDLCKSLASRYEQHVLAPAGRNCSDSENVEGISVRRFRYFFRPFESLAYGEGIPGNLKAQPLRWLLLPFFLIGMVVAIRRELWRFRPDIVHAHWWAPAGLAARLAIATSRRDYKLIITMHGSDFYGLGRQLPWLMKSVLRAADRVAVVSAAMLADANDVGVDGDHVAIAPMGVDLSKLSTAAASTQRNGALFVGRLLESKGCKVLLRAWANIPPALQDNRLSIVGSGTQSTELKALAAELGIAEQCEFIGAVPHDDLPDYYRRAALLVFPSTREEGLGLVVIEAMACGCPVLVSDVASLSGIVIDGETGFVCPKADVDALAARLTELLENPENHRAIGNAAAAAVRQRFGLPSAASRYRTLYDELLDKRA
ncbi:MAG: glycosyltransferase [Gammaproteobacteria bacterium]|nr:glycosyltransferase [Gammaproteobacteria bacterium]